MSRGCSILGRAGFSLVELMMSTLIMGIVIVGWIRIMNATSPYREAQRRAAIEVAAGVLDTFFPAESDNSRYLKLGYYHLAEDAEAFPFVPDYNNSERHRFPERLFPTESPIRYTLQYVCTFKPKRSSVQEPVSYLNHVNDSRYYMWENISSQLKNKPNVFVARICLFDSENEVAPFARFEQLVGIGGYTDEGYPMVFGY